MGLKIIIVLNILLQGNTKISLSLSRPSSLSLTRAFQFTEF